MGRPNAAGNRSVGRESWSGHTLLHPFGASIGLRVALGEKALEGYAIDVEVGFHAMLGVSLQPSQLDLVQRLVAHLIWAVGSLPNEDDAPTGTNAPAAVPCRDEAAGIRSSRRWR